MKKLGRKVIPVFSFLQSSSTHTLLWQRSVPAPFPPTTRVPDIQADAGIAAGDCRGGKRDSLGILVLEMMILKE